MCNFAPITKGNIMTQTVILQGVDKEQNIYTIFNNTSKLYLYISFNYKLITDIIKELYKDNKKIS